MNINLKDTLVDDTIIVQVQPVLEQVQTVTTHFDIVGICFGIICLHHYSLEYLFHLYISL